MLQAQIKHYRLLRKLGEGGMGEVYLALDSKLERQVALKLLSAQMSASPESRQRFLSEARAASALNHPNVCVIHEVGETEDQVPFITMEYVEGQTLLQELRSGALSLPQVIAVGIQVADALSAAHARGIVHRDIKPSNISLNERGQVKVLDFGLAKRIGPDTGANSEATTEAKTASGAILGTPTYMSPEQALGRDLDARTDIFSLGVVLYELASGQRPFAASNAGQTLDRILHSQPEPLVRLNPAMPPEFERIVRKCLEKHPDRRYQSARELVVDLRRLREASAEQSAAPFDRPWDDGTETLVERMGKIESGEKPVSAADTFSQTEVASESDLCIACASVDDQPFAPGQRGWISRFKRHLEVRLEQLSGERIMVSALPVPANPAGRETKLVELVSDAKAMISVLSPPFLKSDACLRLIETFWHGAERGGGLWVENHSRLFNIVKTPVSQQEMPLSLSHLLAQLPSFNFYEQDNETGRIREYDERFGPLAQQRYFERVYDVAQEICRVLRALKESQSPGPPPTPNGAAKTVYLAACTSDLSAGSDQIRRELGARGFRVLPERPLPLVAAELEVAVRRCLEHSQLSVHPVGSFYGIIPEGADCSIVELQNRVAAQRAGVSNLRRVIWLPRDLCPKDPRQEQFLQQLRENPDYHRGAELIQDHVETLKAVLVDKLAPQPRGQTRTGTNLTRVGPLRVYLVCDRSDLEAIEPLEDFLFDEGFEVSLPDFEAGEAEAAEAHQQNLVDCDAAIVFYGKVRPAWVDIKVRSLMKATGYGRPDPIQLQLVYLAPPSDHRKERYRTHAAEVLKQTESFNRSALRPFAQRLHQLREVKHV